MFSDCPQTIAEPPRTQPPRPLDQTHPPTPLAPRGTEYSAIVKTLWTRVWGTLKLALGIVEVATGVLAVKTGVGAPFGVIAIIHGLDTMYAGATQLVSGDEQQTLTKRLANSAFLSQFKPANEQEKKELEKFGEGVDALVGIVGGLGSAGAAFQGAKQLKQGAGAAKAAAGVDDAGAAAGHFATSPVSQNLRRAATKCDDGCFTAETGVSQFLWQDSNLVQTQYDGLRLDHSNDEEINWTFVGLGIMAGATILVARPRKEDGDDQEDELGIMAA